MQWFIKRVFLEIIPTQISYSITTNESQTLNSTLVLPIKRGLNFFAQLKSYLLQKIKHTWHIS